AHQFLEQRLLVGEVKINRSLGDAGRARHVVEPRFRKAPRRELIERRRQDCLASCRGLLRAGGRLPAPGGTRPVRRPSCDFLGSCLLGHRVFPKYDWLVSHTNLIGTGTESRGTETARQRSVGRGSGASPSDGG